MGFWPSWFRRKSAAGGPLTSSEQIWLEVYGSRATNSGVAVNWSTAFGATVVFDAVRVLSEGIAQMPLKLKRARKDGRGSDVATDHPLHVLLHRRPNDLQTSYEFRETLMSHAALTGNGSAFINRVGGKVLEMLPLLPAWVTAKRPKAFELSYVLTLPNEAPIEVPRENILRLHGPSWDGVLGMDVVKLAREAIGLSLAAEKHSANLHGKGGRPSGVLSSEQVLGEEQVTKIREAWTKAFSGDNEARTVVLDGGYKFQQLAMSSVDAQHIETRRFQIEEVSRAFRVFPQMLGHTDKTATYASAEQFFIAHVVHSLGPWVERLEQVLDRDLLTQDEIASGLFFNLNVAGLLRGDAQSRANFYSRGILDGWLLRNEAREKEDLNPIDGLDEPLRPLNMGPGNVPPPVEAPKPSPNPPSDDSED